MRPERPKYYYALSGLRRLLFCDPGATCFASLRTCPWLSYSAPSALPAGFRIGAFARSSLSCSAPLALNSPACFALLFIVLLAEQRKQTIKNHTRLLQ